MQSPTLWNAVVLGGGDPGDAFAAAHGARVKPLIEVAGQPLGLYVLQALRASGRVRRVAYVGPLTPEMEALTDLRVTGSGQLLSNLEAGLRALKEQQGGPGAERVLVVTADIPMLTPQELADLLDQAAAQAPRLAWSTQWCAAKTARQLFRGPAHLRHRA
ncbi:NTP transferase domain-containing protein [Deinococcus lacus]|uniref:NTP transferase domain-containing protein n=1 Tax=Deinococcus lacus TaxID=392561 RepID=A0ABW1YBR0_9DEIO